MKMIRNIGLLFFLIVLLSSCNEEKMMFYGESARVVFKTGIGVAKDFSNGYMLKIRDSLTLRIQGPVFPQDLKVYLRLADVEGYSLPDIEFEQEYAVIPAGTYELKIWYWVKRPAKGAVNYKTNIVVDYEKSGVSEGIDELSRFPVSAFDSFIYEWGTDKSLKITLEEWNTWLKPLIGEPSAIKVRFMINDSNLKWYFPNGLTSYLSEAKKGGASASNVASRTQRFLMTYNSMNKENPLTDENGNLVVFAPNVPK